MVDDALLGSTQNQDTETQQGTQGDGQTVTGGYSLKDDAYDDEAYEEQDECGDDDDSEPQGAPDEYAFESSEEFPMDEAVIGAYSEVAKELDLSQDKAQRVIDKVAPIMHARQAEMLGQAREDWKQASTTDREFGGSRFQENLAVAKRGMDAYGSPELKKLLNESGLGNHPEIIRAFYRAGKTVSQDTVITGRASRSESQTREEKLYPNMKG